MRIDKEQIGRCCVSDAHIKVVIFVAVVVVVVSLKGYCTSNNHRTHIYLLDSHKCIRQTNTSANQSNIFHITQLMWMERILFGMNSGKCCSNTFTNTTTTTTLHHVEMR